MTSSPRRPLHPAGAGAALGAGPHEPGLGGCLPLAGPGAEVTRRDGVLCFAPVKNDKIHELPLSDGLTPVLSEHIRLYPPVAVTLPWKEPGGKPVTFRLLVTT